MGQWMAKGTRGGLQPSGHPCQPPLSSLMGTRGFRVPAAAAGFRAVSLFFFFINFEYRNIVFALNSSGFKGS